MDEKNCEKIRRMVDVKIECDPPRYSGYGGRSMEALHDYYTSWVKDFHAFIRDHRSQDPVELSVEAINEDQCSACGCKWETSAPDEHYDYEYCAGCGAQVTVEAGKIA